MFYFKHKCFLRLIQVYFQTFMRQDTFVTLDSATITSYADSSKYPSYSCCSSKFVQEMPLIKAIATCLSVQVLKPGSDIKYQLYRHTMRLVFSSEIIYTYNISFEFTYICRTCDIRFQDSLGHILYIFVTRERRSMFGHNFLIITFI